MTTPETASPGSTSRTAEAEAIAARFSAIRERVDAACVRAGRDPGSVIIVGVTKTHPPEIVADALAAGVLHLGENRAQELEPKALWAREHGLHPVWHFIGHLQRNKVREVAPHIAVLHSLDSLRLGLELQHRLSGPPTPGLERALGDEPLACYIEVNMAGEASKEGVGPDDVPDLLRGLAGLDRLRVVGLMTVAPQVPDAEQVRPVFRALRELAAAHGLSGLSMGMTEDYPVAIEEGATVVRIGRAIFGPRRE